MINEFIFSINILLSVFGFLSCLYILMDNTLNKQTAKCVISACLAGLVWFMLVYASLLHIYQVGPVELIVKSFIVYFIVLWIKENYILYKKDINYVGF